METPQDVPAWLEALCAVSTDGLLALDQSGRVLFLNAAAERMLGWQRQEALRRKIGELPLLHGDSAGETHPLLHTLRTGTALPPTMLRLQRPGAEPVTVLVQSVPLFGDRQALRGVAVSLREAEDAPPEALLRPVEAHAAELEATISAIADGVVIYDAAMEVTHASTAAESLLGLTPDLQRLPFQERLIRCQLRAADGHPLMPEEWPSLRALRGETLCGEIVSVTHPDGRVLWLSHSAAPIRDPQGAIIGVVATFTDITVMRELQQRQDDFLHVVSHDLLLPLTVIHGHMQLIQQVLRETGIEVAVADSIAAIERAEQRMKVMVHDLIDVAGLDGGQLRLELQPINLAPYVANMLRRLQGAIDTQRITAEIPETLPPARADANRLECILVNLLSNALKYSPADEPVRIRAEAGERSVDVSVVDCGRGISEEDLPHIFNRFYRAQRERKAEGIGLGLYITKGLVEAQGGHIRVVSIPGQGSTFTFSLPKATSGD